MLSSLKRVYTSLLTCASQRWSQRIPPCSTYWQALHPAADAFLLPPSCHPVVKLRFRLGYYHYPGTQM